MGAPDINIYRLEDILAEMKELLDESEEIVNGMDDFSIGERAKYHWLKTMRENLESDNQINTISNPRTTMRNTIDELWNDYYAYVEEDE